jgi:hypothetical protein
MSRKTWLEEPHQRFDDYKLQYNFSCQVVEICYIEYKFFNIAYINENFIFATLFHKSYFHIYNQNKYYPHIMVLILS